MNMPANAGESLSRARSLAQAGWTALLDGDDVRSGRASLVEARRVLAAALKQPAPQKVRFEIVGVLAELSSQLGDPGTVERCSTLLPVLAPKNDPVLVESMLRRMIERWGAVDSAEKGLANLQQALGPQRVASIRSLVEERRRLAVQSPLSTRQILELKAHLARSGVVTIRGGDVLRDGGDSLRRTSAWLEDAGLPTIACLDFLGALGGMSDAAILVDVEPLEPYDVPNAWPAVAIGRRVRAAERARGIRTPGPASGSVSVSAPVPSSGGPPPGSSPSGTTSAPQRTTGPTPTGAGEPPRASVSSQSMPRVSPPTAAPVPAASPTPSAPPDGLEIPFEDPYGRFQGRFVDDGRAGYVYLLDRSGKRRLMTPLWVYNRSTAPDRLPAELPDHAPGPPMVAASMVSPAPWPQPRADEVELHMADDGAWVAVQIGGRLMALLDYHQRVGWSRLLAKDTPFGLAWTPDLPESL